MNDSASEAPDKIFGLDNKELAYLLLRIGLGVNLFFHGLVRLPKLSGFVGYMEGQFAESLLPGFLVTPMAYAIPIVEAVVGLMLLLGLKTKFALIGVSLLMMVLITGCCLIENWGPLDSQMMLLLVSSLLIALLPFNRLALTKD
ncbi:MAG: DoxX family membrane protein [Roseibacillus sp.]